MTIQSDLQPDQRRDEWDDHVFAQECVFEPFTSALATPAIAALEPLEGRRVLDVGAGSGGIALRLAEGGANVAAVDFSEGMVSRIAERAAAAGRPIEALAMDGQALEFPDASFDAALSVFGVILFPDAARGLAEMRRVVTRGGKVAVVTWTRPECYELATELRAAVLSVWPDQPAAPLPAQLRFREAADFRSLFLAAGFEEVEITTVEKALVAPSARWLADRISFAPGMAAMMAGVGERRARVLEAFIDGLERRFGSGEVALRGMAFLGIARVPWSGHENVGQRDQA